MCREGIRIGRQTQIKPLTLGVTNASQQLAKGDINRIALIIGSCATLAVTISNRVVVAGQGIVIPAASEGKTLWQERHGQFASGDIFAIGSGAGPETLLAWEVIWLDDDKQITRGF